LHYLLRQMIRNVVDGVGNLFVSRLAQLLVAQLYERGEVLRHDQDISLYIANNKDGWIRHVVYWTIADKYEHELGLGLAHQSSRRKGATAAPQFLRLKEEEKDDEDEDEREGEDDDEDEEDNPHVEKAAYIYDDADIEECNDVWRMKQRRSSSPTHSGRPPPIRFHLPMVIAKKDRVVMVSLHRYRNHLHSLISKRPLIDTAYLDAVHGCLKTLRNDKDERESESESKSV
jgi:hypothetical protein